MTSDRGTAPWKLPCSLEVARQLVKVCGEPHENAAALESIAARDLASAVNLLTAANAPTHDRVSATLADAFGVLGWDSASAVALAMYIEPETLPGRGLHETAMAAWQHAHCHSLAARTLAEETATPNPHAIAVLALLKNAGRVAMLAEDGEALRKSFKASLRTGRSWQRGERERELARLIAEHCGIERGAARQSQAQIASIFLVADALAEDIVLHEFSCTKKDVRQRTKEFYTSFQSDFRQLKLPPLDDLLARVEADTSPAKPAAAGAINRSDEAIAVFAQANASLSRRVFDAEEKLCHVAVRVAALEENSMRDIVTGLFNRAALDDALDREVARCRRSGEMLGILYLDIDRFKRLNDVVGHAFGDRVLREVSATMSNVARRSDIVARIGGDEFLVLPANRTEVGLPAFAERIRQAVESLQIAAPNGKPVAVTVSIGAVAVPLPEGGDDKKFGGLLIEAADAAMYAAKDEGRNRVVYREGDIADLLDQA